VPFKNAVTTRWPKAQDITATFDRQGVTKAADAGGVDVMVKELKHKPDGQERAIKSLLIVDESVAEGKTAAAIIEHLRAAGMPKEAKVTLAVCCRMK
jgi:uracil phosphoribosyltransferase